MRITVQTAANYLMGKARRRNHYIEGEDLRNLLVLVEKRFQERFEDLNPRVYKDRYKLFDAEFFEWKTRVFKGQGVIRSSKKHNKVIECLDVVYEMHYSIRLKQVV